MTATKLFNRLTEEEKQCMHHFIEKACEANKLISNKEVKDMSLNVDLMRTGGDAYLNINGNTYPIRITSTTVENNPYSDVQWTLEADVMRYHPYYGGDVYIRHKHPSIKDVIFNDPATIILWQDGTKTVVKCGELDTYDPEKGLVMAITKKLYGNKGNYYNEIKKWTDKYWEKHAETTVTVKSLYPGATFLDNALTSKLEDIRQKMYKAIELKLNGDVVDNVNNTIEENLGE